MAKYFARLVHLSFHKSTVLPKYDRLCDILHFPGLHSVARHLTEAPWRHGNTVGPYLSFIIETQNHGMVAAAYHTAPSIVGQGRLAVIPHPAGVYMQGL
jgi:hypothetical protein